MQIATKYPDIFFTPEYQELFKDTAFGGEPCHFNRARIDYRFYKRPIAGTPYFDIVSPYGYSGPAAIEETGIDDWVEFYDTFEQCCCKRNIIAEFARIHPFIGDWHDTNQFHYEHDIFYIDLTKSENEIWKGFDKGCRSAIKKQIKGIGLNDRETISTPWYQIFSQSPNYQFNQAFFDKLQQMQGFKFYEVVDYPHVIAGAVCLTYGDYCHYFLGAGGYQNYLIWRAILQAKHQGCKIFNLGGGLKAGDSLESFKRSFSHDSKPFYTYRKIHNQAVYDELSKGIVTDFFPAYRAERTKQ